MTNSPAQQQKSVPDFCITSNFGETFPVSHGFTLAQLQDAFEKVQNPEDWKVAIKAPVAIADLSVTVAAIEYFTATSCCISKSAQEAMGAGYDASRDPKNCYYICTEGYRMGPAGDH